MPAATTIVACLLGYRFGGLDGACIGAVAAWVLQCLGSAMMDHFYKGLIEEGREAVCGTIRSLRQIDEDVTELKALVVKVENLENVAAFQRTLIIRNTATPEPETVTAP